MTSRSPLQLITHVTADVHAFVLHVVWRHHHGHLNIHDAGLSRRQQHENVRRWRQRGRQSDVGKGGSRGVGQDQELVVLNVCVVRNVERKRQDEVCPCCRQRWLWKRGAIIIRTYSSVRSLSDRFLKSHFFKNNTFFYKTVPIKRF